MNRGATVIIIGVASILLSAGLFFYSSNYFNLLGGIIGLISFILGILWKIEDDKITQLNLEENRQQHLQILEAVEKVEEKVIIDKNISQDLENSKLRQLMSKITINLQKEHFSKDELLRRLNKPVYCLLFHKTEEASLSDKRLKTLRDNILPALGFKFVRGSRGVYILPSSQLPPLKNREEIEKWVDSKIIKKIPQDYRYIFSFVSLIDLRFTISIKRDKLTKKYDTLLETINAAELINFSEGLNYLQRKKNLSIKDIIEIPNLFFLSDNTSLDFNKRQILKEKNEEIIEQIEKDLKTEIFNRNLCDINSGYLTTLLKKYILLRPEDIEIIKSNAQFWEDLLNNELMSKHD